MRRVDMSVGGFTGWEVSRLGVADGPKWAGRMAILTDICVRVYHSECERSHLLDYAELSTVQWLSLTKFVTASERLQAFGRIRVAHWAR